MNTRKKPTKVYRDEGSEDEDFSASESDADIPDGCSSDSDSSGPDSEDDFTARKKSASNKKPSCSSGKKPSRRRDDQFARRLLSRLTRPDLENDAGERAEPAFSVKDLTERDKLLPTVLDLSESDSSEDEVSSSNDKRKQRICNTEPGPSNQYTNLSEDEEKSNSYTQDWSTITNTEEIARKSFENLQRHTELLQKVKHTVDKYEENKKSTSEKEANVKDLLTLGEEEVNISRTVQDSESEKEDWEEVKESKPLPQSGIQLVVDFPSAASKKCKEVDVEMMMRRKINRVKKEYQVYMHKVHVLCWLGHGNYISTVLNDEELLSAALKLISSKSSYPKGRLTMKYLIEITKWYRKQVTLIPDKHENKFKPNSPPLKQIILKEIMNKTVSSVKNLAYIFVCLMRSLGVQCRVILNFVTLPIRPLSSELCSLATKHKKRRDDDKDKPENIKKQKTKNPVKVNDNKISQLDGANDSECSMEISDIEQLDGNYDLDVTVSKRTTRSSRLSLKPKDTSSDMNSDEAISPAKRMKNAHGNISKEIMSNVNDSLKSVRKRKSPTLEVNQNVNKKSNTVNKSPASASLKLNEVKSVTSEGNNNATRSVSHGKTKTKISQRRTGLNQEAGQGKSTVNTIQKKEGTQVQSKNNLVVPVASEFFNKTETTAKSPVPKININECDSTNSTDKIKKTKKKVDDTGPRSSQKPQSTKESIKQVKTSKYFTKTTKKDKEEDQRVSHRDLVAKMKSPNTSKLDVREDLKKLIRERAREVKSTKTRSHVKGKTAKADESEDEFKPKKTRVSDTRSAVDRRVLSSDEDSPKRSKVDVWVEVFVEEEEQWVAVDVSRALVHCAEKLYKAASSPVSYVVAWDNSNHLKDVTRRYVPHWNTVTRRQRVPPAWWTEAVAPWLGPGSARGREEDEQLDRIMHDAPLPKVIGEYKNHPLYALQRHLLKFEALYPPDAPPLGFVRGEAVYARSCVHVCRSRDTWLKEAKTVRLGEQPYKVVKARPKWDKLSNRVISDIPLEVFGPWQVQDYEPPTAQGGVVPRNAYGNVELFKQCMLPKGTVHLQLPGLNKVAKKLNIDCAPAMTGFDFHGGWTHPVFDGFVVCEEFKDVLVDAWHKEQEEAEKREQEKIEARVYGNWKRLIKGLLIRERLQEKYAFEIKPPAKNKRPRLVVKKK